MIEDRDGLGVTIHPAAAPDLDAIARIWFEGWRSTGLATADDDNLPALRRLIDCRILEDWSLLVAMLDQQRVGMLALTAATVDQLFVAPAFQRRGIGVALLKEAKRQLPSGFRLRTNVGNVGARRFYEREGLTLERIGRHPTRKTAVAYYRWRP